MIKHLYVLRNDHHNKSSLTPVIRVTDFLSCDEYLCVFTSEFNLGNFGCTSHCEGCVNAHFLQVLEKPYPIPIALGRNKFSSLLACS